MKSTTKEHKKALEKLIMIGKDKGYLTYAELNDLLPEDLLTQDQIEPIVTILEELDIVVSEVIPDADTLVVESGAKAQSTSAEAAVAALA
jgi:RNA polymerase primary sigma factor